MKRIALIALITLVVAATAAPALAGRGRSAFGHAPGAHNKFFMPGWRHMEVFEDTDLIGMLDLTDDQAERIQQINFAFRENHIKLKADVETAQLALDRALSKTPMDRDGARKAAKRLADVQGKMFLQAINYKLDLVEVLTAAQQRQLQTLRSQVTPKKPAEPEPDDAKEK